MKKLILALVAITLLVVLSAYTFYDPLGICAPYCFGTTPLTTCPDGICSPAECQSGLCPEDCGIEQDLDCGPVCGDLVCEGNESKINCPADCRLNSDSDPPTAENLPFEMGFLAIRTEEQGIGYREELPLAIEAGARWSRNPFWYMGEERGFIFPSASVTQLSSSGINVLANIEVKPSGQPSNYSVFKTRLAEVVQANPEIEYWQIGNEPDLFWARAGSTPQDYVQFFLQAAPVIRENCSGCKIVLAGISNQHDSSSNNFQFFKEVLQGIKQGSPSPKPFNVFDFHFFFKTSEEAANAIPSYKQLL